MSYDKPDLSLGDALCIQVGVVGAEATRVILPYTRTESGIAWKPIEH
jgi:hypothetical protein